MIDWNLSKLGIYRIHPSIYLGQYPTEAALLQLVELGVADILNVSGGIYQDARFQVTSIPVQDLQEMPRDTALQVAGCIRRAVQTGRRIFVHCMAGQNRSPGSIYLGLRALGFADEVAVRMIEDNALDAVAKHHRIITDRVVAYVVGQDRDGSPPSMA